MITHITADEAVAALTKAGFKVTDPEDSAHGRTLVHCYMGSFGADWDVDSAVALARHADDIAWMPNIFGHELAVLADGKIHSFNVKRPVTRTDGEVQS